MARTIVGGQAANVICNAIYTAEVVYRDEAGNVLFTQPMGQVYTGAEILVKIPVAGDISITVAEA